LAPWAIWLFGAAFFAAVILLALRMLPGDATWWMILASICAGSALAAAVVKPWRG
jgi:hypothetical protein